MPLKYNFGEMKIIFRIENGYVINFLHIHEVFNSSIFSIILQGWPISGFPLQPVLIILQ